MSTQVESSGAEFAAEQPAEVVVGKDLESIRTWAHVWTLVAVFASLVLIAMCFSEGRNRPAGSTVLLTLLLIGLCRVITVFAGALLRIERKLHGLPPVA